MCSGEIKENKAGCIKAKQRKEKSKKDNTKKLNAYKTAKYINLHDSTKKYIYVQRLKTLMISKIQNNTF